MTEQAGTLQRVTVAEAAVALGVSTTTIRRMLRRGQIEGERVVRPQGTAFLVTLPDEALHAAEDAAPTQHVAGAPPRGNASPAGQLAAWSETFLVPLVAALERQVERVAQLERENGRQAAELERATSLAVKLSDELDTARAQISTLEARTAPQSAEPAPGPFSGRLHEWIAAVVAVLAIVAVVALLMVRW